MQYYTDPASSYTFRTLKSALSFLETGTVSKHAIIQRTSVHDLYSFEISTDMVIVLLVFCLSNENLHDILFPSCLHFGHYQPKTKVVNFVPLPLDSSRIVFPNFQMVSYLHFFQSLVT